MNHTIQNLRRFQMVSFILLVASWLGMIGLCNGIFGDMDFFQKFHWRVVLLPSMLVQAILSYVLAKKIGERAISSRTQALRIGVRTTLAVLLSGTMMGSILNWIDASEFDFTEIGPYLVKPIFWTSLIGVPCALVVGLIYGLIIHKMLVVQQTCRV